MQYNLQRLATFIVLTLFSGLIFFSCKVDDSPAPSVSAQDGYFIINEGGFGNANTTLSFYNRQDNSVLNNVFRNANNRPLGDQTQSMTIFDGRGFIVVQNSSKVEVIDRETFESLATIGPDEGIISPRHFVGINPTKGYVTDWGADGLSGTLKVLDLDSYQVTSTIPIGAGPNELILIDNRVYVTNSGGLGSDNTVVEVDPQTDTIVNTIVVGDNPSSLTTDAEGSIWVVGGGKLVYDPVDFSLVEEESTAGFIARIVNNKVTVKISSDEINVGPSSVTIDPGGQILYFRYKGGVYAMSTTNTTLPTTPLIDQRFYGLGIDPVSGDILAGEAPDFSSNGSFLRYSSTGNLIQGYSVGIAPNSFAF